MKRLWKTIPPCLSDTMGFEAVLNQTEGMGIIDDASHYKPLRMGPEGGRAHGGRPHNGGAARPRFIGGIRVIGSEIRNADIIMGTHQKVMQAFREGSEELHPRFVLLARAPSASMIGSDLEADAQLITRESGLPAAGVDIHGDKDYLYGISVTLEAMGRLLLKKQQTRPHTVNLLGCNEVDGYGNAPDGAQELVREAGMEILSRWGLKETTENLLKASAASLNWVVNVSGFRLARYMEAEFGIPYVFGAPYGKEQCGELVQALRSGKNATSPEPTQAPQALIVGEQLTACAIREALRRQGYQGIRVLSFYEMDKSVMQSGDAKLGSEEELQKQAASVELVIADPDYRAAVKRDVAWIDLPNEANRSPVERAEPFNRMGDALDQWLYSRLQQGRRT